MTRIVASGLSAAFAFLFAFLGAGSDEVLSPSHHFHDARVWRPVVSTTTTVTPTTTVAVPANAKCPHWWQLARLVGWEKKQLLTLDAVIWRESRCLPTVYNAGDPNGGSYGLLQVNGFWCSPSRYYPTGYLQAHGVLVRCADLYQPSVALAAGLAVFKYSAQENNGDGWQPWMVRD